jgi:hypothetical protein
MKAVLTYWAFGCAIIGWAAVGSQQRCPDDPMPVTEVLTVIAIWPAIVVGAMRLPRDAKIACKVSG